MSDPFFSKTKCDRCRADLKGCRQMSWFTEETLCVTKCIPAEQELRNAMRAAGMDPRKFEGCGYVPKADGSSGPIECPF